MLQNAVFCDDILKKPSASGGVAPRPLPGALPQDPTGGLLHPPDPCIIFLLFHFSPVPCLMWGSVCVCVGGIVCVCVCARAHTHVSLQKIWYCTLYVDSPQIWVFLLISASGGNCSSVHFGGPGVIVCKSHATHRAFITCNMPCATWYEGTAQLLSLTELNLHLF